MSELSGRHSEQALTHLEQYKMLREEIMHNVRTVDTIQYAAAVGAAAAYAWLVSNKVQISSNFNFIWFIPPLFLCFCAFKSVDLTKRIWQIAAYLVLIEQASFRSDPELPGWEQYKRKSKLRLYDWIMSGVTALFWVGVIVTAFLLSRNANIQGAECG